jgi:predicted MPP superfamily phosphohydrolase
VYTPRFTVTERVVRPLGWTAPRAVRIAFVTDTHTGAPFNGLERLRRIVEATNALGADLILLGGDYVYHGIFSQRPTNAALAMGNHGLLTITR